MSALATSMHSSRTGANVQNVCRFAHRVQPAPDTSAQAAVPSSGSSCVGYVTAVSAMSASLPCVKGEHVNIRIERTTTLSRSTEHRMQPVPPQHPGAHLFISMCI